MKVGISMEELKVETASYYMKALANIAIMGFGVLFNMNPIIISIIGLTVLYNVYHGEKLYKELNNDSKR